MKERATRTKEQDQAGTDRVGMERVWQAVIVSTIREWISGPLRRKLEAEKYLFGDSSDFTLVCQSAGMNADYLRARLGRLKR
jgi:hypothetical protein